jgi:menaquinone-dependent protoporphyrinogen IX oxidase
MMKAIVVYRSKTGFVQKYADWIAEELSINAISGEKITIDDLIEFDTIIFGGGLYAGGINGIKLIKNNLDKLKGKNLVLFATGASPGRKEEINEVWNKNFAKEDQDKCHFFYLRGGFNFDKLGMKDKMLMTLLKKKLQSKKEISEDEQGMLEAYDEPADFTDRNNIKHLVDLVKKF